MSEVKLINVEENPEKEVAGHTFCTGKEIAGESIGITEYTLKKGWFGQGGTSVEHTHDEAEHVFYILSGALTILANAKEYTAHCGEALYVPAGVAHASKNAFEGTTTYIALTFPPT